MRRFYFHLALAHLKTGDRKAAADAMRNAREKRFTHDTIHPLEQKAFKEQIRELDPTLKPVASGDTLSLW